LPVYGGVLGTLADGALSLLAFTVDNREGRDMAGLSQIFEAMHCWLKLDDGRIVLARYDPKPNEETHGYFVLVDRHDLPDDWVKRAEASMNAQDFVYIKALVPPEQIDFDTPAYGVFPDYQPASRYRF
jgi:hypothetical protein